MKNSIFAIALAFVAFNSNAAVQYGYSEMDTDNGFGNSVSISREFTHYINDEAYVTPDHYYTSGYERPIEDLIKADILLTETASEATYDLYFEVPVSTILENQQIIEAVIPVNEPLNFKYISKQPIQLPASKTQL